MLIDFTDARWTLDSSGAWLSIRVPSADIARDWLEQMEEGRTYTAKLSPKRFRRSLDANAYYWVLVSNLAQEMRTPPLTIYRRHIAELGNYAVLTVAEDALEHFRAAWCSGHLGRFIETKANRQPGYITVLAYYGSSDFDTRQMSILIDNAIQDCKAIGIETRPEEEIKSLLEAWDAARN